MKTIAFVKRLSFALGISIALTCSAQAMQITYDLFPVSGGESTLTGSITTDGTIGRLEATNISAWSIASTGKTAFSITSIVPGTTFSCGSACGLDADDSFLRFDFAGMNDITFEWVGFAAVLLVGGPAGFTAGLDLENGSFAEYCNQCTSPIGAAAKIVPVPQSILLIGIAFIAFGLTRKQIKSVQSIST